MRLWLSHYEAAVLLVPLASWVAPGNRGDALFLGPSLNYCERRLHWLPEIVVADMGYIHLAEQRRMREGLGVAVVTPLRADMKLVEPFEAGPVAVCSQGQRLEWLGYEPLAQEQWFGVQDVQPLCDWCWQQQTCPRQFGYPAAQHEILLGAIPFTSGVAQRLLRQARPWIEASQSYEKNQLGLSDMFLNSLRLTWTMCLLADAVALLRAKVLLSRPACLAPLKELMPQQLVLGLQ